MSNILFIHHVSTFSGGAEKYLYDLVSGLDRKHKIFFISQEPGALSEHLNKLGVSSSFQSLPAFRKGRFFLSKWFAVWHLIRLCRRNKIDLICSNSYRVTPYAIWASKVLKIPSMTIIQDFVLGEKLDKFHVFDSDLLVTVSQCLSAGWRNCFKREIVTVHNGMDINKFIQMSRHGKSLREEYSIPAKHKIVGMVGNFAPVKGHRLFLDAMKIVGESFPDVTFVIVGDSLGVENLSLPDLKEEAKNKGLETKVIFTGSRSDVPSILKSFDVLVLPSSRESFGRVVMEAMAMQVAVVATDCGGPKEIIENGISGIIVPVNDAARIAQETVALLKDDMRCESLGERGYLRIKDCFSPERTYFRFGQIFETLL